MASRSFSKLVLSAKFVLVVLVTAWVGGCVTVRPEEKEFLANPAMIFGSGGQTEAQEHHVLTNREGTYGAGGVTGGGCGCN